ncbi:MAG: hypothetical protein KG075_23810 [Alphaproteobacteria bacterium]|nr:hypothetical protein [Alphaproteobacteria bacterium]
MVATLNSRDQSAVGDVTSDARGSGARFNTGKPPMELIPVSVIAAAERERGVPARWAVHVLDLLGQWQAGTRSAAQVLAEMPVDVWTDCALIFDYGRKKYAEWNWAKGMAWSVPTACAVRHLLAILRGEQNDPESGLPHRGHVACNLVMLALFETTYREGDDRPIQWLSTREIV